MECPVKNMSTKRKAVLGGILLLFVGLAIGFGVGYKVGASRARNGFLQERQSMMRQYFGGNRGGYESGRQRGMKGQAQGVQNGPVQSGVPTQPLSQQGGAAPAAPTGGQETGSGTPAAQGGGSVMQSQ